jgi:hypothetical protein
MRMIPTNEQIEQFRRELRAVKNADMKDEEKYVCDCKNFLKKYERYREYFCRNRKVAELWRTAETI